MAPVAGRAPADRLATGRLTLSVLAVLTVALVGLGFAVHAILASELKSDLRARLADRVALVRSLDGRVSVSDLASRVSGGGVNARVVTGDGTVIPGAAPADPPQAPASGSGPPGRARRPDPLAKVAALPLAPVVTRGDLLTVDQQLSTGGVVQLSVGTRDVGQTLSQLAEVELTGGAIGLLLAALLGWRLVALALRPLGRLTTLARETTAGRRGGRLRPDRPTTDLGVAAAAFDEMLDALEAAAAEQRRAEERLRRFLSDAGHELRTPVTALQVTAETLLRSEPDRERREELALAAVRASRRAGRLVDDLITTARAEAPGWQRRDEPLDLRVVAADALGRAGELAGGRILALDAPTPVGVQGDPERLGQVLDNLLANARHATGPAGHVTVRVECTGDHAVLTVADDGPGIPAAERERIFERFARLRPEAYDGSGLGLPVARALVTAHGGTLAAVEGGVGASFELALPLREPASPFAPPRVPVPSSRDLADVTS